jgi:ferredoxin-NADP reductase
MTNHNGYIQLIVTDKRQLTDEVIAYRLSAKDGTELPLVSAGSHVELPVVINGKTEYRAYSICSNPLQRDFYEIAIQHRVDAQNGHSGAAYLQQHLTLGVELICSLPRNHFHLHADASPALLIAGGIGITPIKAIAHTLASRGRRFQLHYAGKRQEAMAYAKELKLEFLPQFTGYASDQDQRMDIMHLLSEASSNTHIYACGPKRMLDDIHTCATLLSIDKERLQTERFLSESQAGDKAVVLELALSNKVILAAADQPLLAAVRDAGINIAFDCCVGDCGSCAVKVLKGTADHRDHVLSEGAKAQGMMCLCVSRATTEMLVLAL